MSNSTGDGSHLEELTEEECVRLLGISNVGRIAFAVNSEPWIFPVNYRVFGDDGWRILVSTRPGNRIDRAPRKVAFEVDGFDAPHHAGWSVLVRGTLHHVGHNEPEPRPENVQPATWVNRDISSWLTIIPLEVTGRRLIAESGEWPLPDGGYL